MLEALGISTVSQLLVNIHAVSLKATSWHLHAQHLVAIAVEGLGELIGGTEGDASNLVTIQVGSGGREGEFRNIRTTGRGGEK